MDIVCIGRLTGDKLKDPATYWLAGVVGTLINGYGHLLVPWLHGDAAPVSTFLAELTGRPGLSALSVFLGFAFPFCVGLYSAVAARYKNRRTESIADFPERKPDPVFRATHAGDVIEAGATTRMWLDRFGVVTAQDVLGDALWAGLVTHVDAPTGAKIHFAPEGADYLVRHVRTRNDCVNLYLTRLPTSLIA